ncbi:Uncharacterised protein [Mycobacteroides abscessus subsp. abscessus]|nr:Uncharacterised protein [Mycobacteroides abscessus subsp. abscessus]
MAVNPPISFWMLSNRLTKSPPVVSVKSPSAAIVTDTLPINAEMSRLFSATRPSSAGNVSAASPSSALRAAISPVSTVSPCNTLSMSAVRWFSAVIAAPSSLSRCASCGARPANIEFISEVILAAWLRPPPLSSMEIETISCSTDAPAEVRSVPMVSPGWSTGAFGSCSGRVIATKMSPSGVAWRSSAVVPRGSRMSSRISSSTSARKLVVLISSTTPMSVPPIFTWARSGRLSASSKTTWMV